MRTVATRAVAACTVPAHAEPRNDAESLFALGPAGGLQPLHRGRQVPGLQRLRKP